MEERMRPLLFGSLMLSFSSVLAGCQPAPSALNTDGSSGLEGTVTVGPNCPGPAVAESPCPDRPYPAGLSIETSVGTLLVHVMTRADGTYRTALTPGVYRVVPDQPASGFPHAQVVDVTVQTRMFTRLDVMYDTGLR